MRMRVAASAPNAANAKVASASIGSHGYATSAAAPASGPNISVVTRAMQ